MKEPWRKTGSVASLYFLNPRERGLYRIRALLARQRFSPHRTVHYSNSYGFCIRWKPNFKKLTFRPILLFGMFCNNCFCAHLLAMVADPLLRMSSWFHHGEKVSFSIIGEKSAFRKVNFSAPFSLFFKDCTGLSLVYLYRMYSMLVILPRLNLLRQGYVGGPLLPV